jgi:hypothetical protein
MHIDGGRVGAFKMAKHARTTITVPADLKARMDEVDESVNWSAIAAQAFEQKLAEITKRRGAKDMKDVINRLRASKKQFVNDQYQAGYDAGQEWAKDSADAGELILLRQWKNSAGNDWNACFATGENDAYGACEKFVFTIWPEHDGDRQMAKEFWENNASEGQSDHPEDTYVLGFAEGALAIWEEVEDQI